MKRVLEIFKDDPSSRLDYVSLQSLSWSARKEATRTMSSLSSRVNKGRQRDERNACRRLNNSRTSNRGSRKKMAEGLCDGLSQVSRRTSPKKGLRVSSSVGTVSSESTKIGEIRRRKQGNPSNYAHVSYPVRSRERHGAGVNSRSWWNPFKSRP